MLRLIFVILLVLVLGGWATGAKKQTTQPLPSRYDKPTRTYQQEPTWDYDYEPIETPKKEVKRTYAGGIVGKKTSVELNKYLSQ